VERARGANCTLSQSRWSILSGGVMTNDMTVNAQ